MKCRTSLVTFQAPMIHFERDLGDYLANRIGDRGNYWMSLLSGLFSGVGYYLLDDGMCERKIALLKHPFKSHCA